MTVIACTLKEMSADSLCHEEDTSHYFAEKMRRLTDGSIIGGAGNHPEKVMEWILRGKPANDRPLIDEEKDDFSVLHLTNNGIHLFNNSLDGYRLKERNFAIGCGSDIALYCMRVLKMTPAQAVTEAGRINMFCGGEVDTLVLA